MSDNPTTAANSAPAATSPATGAPAEQPKPQPAQAAPEANAQRDAADQPLGENGLKALQQERAAREQLERELKELKPLKDQMQALAGIFGDKGGDPGKDIVTTLQEQVSAMQRDNLVNNVARSHGITDEKDVAFLRSAPDEAAMQALAERLKATGSAPSSPAPDPSQASAPMTPEQAEAAEYEHYFPTPS